MEEIEEAAKECLRKRTDRKKSYNNKSWDGVTEKLEKTKRQLTKIVKRRASPPRDDLRRALELASQKHQLPPPVVLDPREVAKLRRSVSVDSPLVGNLQHSTEPLRLPVRRESLIAPPSRRSPETSPVKPQRRASGFLKVDEETNDEVAASPVHDSSLARSRPLQASPRSPNVDELDIIRNESLERADSNEETDEQPFRADLDNTPGFNTTNRSMTFSSALSANVIGLPFADDDADGNNMISFAALVKDRPAGKLLRNTSVDSALSPRMPTRRKSVETGRPNAPIVMPAETAQTDEVRPRRRRLSFFGAGKSSSGEEEQTLQPPTSPDRQQKKERRGSFLSGAMAQKARRSPNREAKNVDAVDGEADAVVNGAITVKAKRRESFISGLMARRASMGNKQSTTSASAPRSRRRSSFFGGSGSPSMSIESMRESFQRSASDSGMASQASFRKCRDVLDEALIALEYEPMYMPGDSDDFNSEELAPAAEPMSPSKVARRPIGSEALSNEGIKDGALPIPLNIDSSQAKASLPDDDPRHPSITISSSGSDSMEVLRDEYMSSIERESDGKVGVKPAIVMISDNASDSLVKEGRTQDRDAISLADQSPSSSARLLTQAKHELPKSILRPSKYLAATLPDVVDLPKARRRSSFFGGNNHASSASGGYSDAAPQPAARRGSMMDTSAKIAKRRTHSLEPPHSSQRQFAALGRMTSADMLKMPARRASLVGSPSKKSGSTVEGNVSNGPSRQVVDEKLRPSDSHSHPFRDVHLQDPPASVNVEKRNERRGSFFGLKSSNRNSSQNSFGSFDSGAEAQSPSGSMKKPERRGSFFGLGSIKRSSSHGSQSSFASFDSGNDSSAPKATRRGSFLGMNIRRSKSDHSEASFGSDDGGYMIAPTINRMVSDQSQSSFASFDDSSHFFSATFTKVIGGADNRSTQQPASDVLPPQQVVLEPALPTQPKADKDEPLYGTKPRRRSSFFGSGKPKKSYLKDNSSSLASLDTGDWSSDLEPSFPDDSALRKKTSFFGMMRPAPVDRTSSNDSFGSYDGTGVAFVKTDSDDDDKAFSNFGDSYSTVAVSDSPSNLGSTV